MKLRKGLAAVLTLALSGGLHAAALNHLAPDTPARSDLAAGGTEAIPLLGDSFADMVAGAAAAMVTPDTAPKVAADAPAAPVAAPGLTPVVPVPAPSADLEQASPSKPVQAPAPEPATRTAPVADTITTRPKKRPQRVKSAEKPAPKAVGNADRDRRAGSAQGSDAGKSNTARAATAGGKAGDGGKAAASYGSTILRKISAIRKARAPAKGRAVVGFVIAANGGLQSVQIVASSGHAGLDQVALDHIRRAAPFPAPPSGAQRQFAFEFLGGR